MSDKRTFLIRSPESLRDAMLRVFQTASHAIAGGPVEVVVSRYEDGRTESQNSKLWPMLGDIARQVEWPVDGRMQKIRKEEWKTILTSALTSEQRVAQGVNGGFVMLGRSTSRMRKREFCDLIEIIYAFGSEHDVKWSEPFPAEYLSYQAAAA